MENRERSSAKNWRWLYSIILFLVLFLPGCSMEDITSFTNDKVASDQERLYSLSSDPEGKGAQAVERAGREARDCYDEVSGTYVTRSQYYAYNVTDAVKHYGWYVALPCFLLGFTVRRLVHSSASVRKLGLFLELWVPLIYVFLAYVLSAVADRI